MISINCSQLNFNFDYEAFECLQTFDRYFFEHVLKDFVVSKVVSGPVSTLSNYGAVTCKKNQIPSSPIIFKMKWWKKMICFNQAYKISR